MYREQVASQRMINALVDDQIASMGIGTARRQGNDATAPVLVRFRDGTSMSGTLVLRRYRSRWYVYSITAGPSPGDPSTMSAPGIPSSVVYTSVLQQTRNQSFAQGVLYGRFHQVGITKVTKNWNTATLRLRLGGGTRRARNATMTCLSRVGTNGKTYWFPSRSRRGRQLRRMLCRRSHLLLRA